MPQPVASSACEAGGIYKAAELPQADSSSTGANTRSGSAARAARDSGADVEPADCRAFPSSGGNANATPTPTPTLNPPPTIEPEIAGTAEVEPPPREHATLHGDDAMTVFVPPLMPGATHPIPEAMPAPVTGTTPEASDYAGGEAGACAEAHDSAGGEAGDHARGEAGDYAGGEAGDPHKRRSRRLSPEAKPATTQEAKPVTLPEAKPATTQEAKPVTCPRRSRRPMQEAKPATMPEATPSPTPEATPAPTAVVDVDPIAEQLRNLANGKFDRIIGNKKERALSKRSNRPKLCAAVDHGRKCQCARYGRHCLPQPGRADGLDPADYPVPNFSSLSDPAALAEAEIRLTTSVITYAHQRRSGAYIGRA